MLCNMLCMVLSTLHNAVSHRRHDVWSVHPTMQAFHLRYSRELAEITRSVIITIWSSVRQPWVWNSVLPQSDYLCKCLELLIQYAELPSTYCMVCCCEIWACPTHSGCSYKHRGIWRILEFELHFWALIDAHFCIHVDNIQIIRKKLCEPALEMTNLAWHRTK